VETRRPSSKGNELMLIFAIILMYVIAGIATFICSAILAPVVHRRVSRWSFAYSLFDYEFAGPYVALLVFWPIGWGFIFIWIFMTIILKLTANASIRLEKIVSDWEKRV
jgi:L-asparagine transporter-like permease